MIVRVRPLRMAHCLSAPNGVITKFVLSKIIFIRLGRKNLTGHCSIVTYLLVCRANLISSYLITRTLGCLHQQAACGSICVENYKYNQCSTQTKIWCTGRLADPVPEGLNGKVKIKSSKTGDYGYGLFNSEEK